MDAKHLAVSLFLLVSLISTASAQDVVQTEDFEVDYEESFEWDVANCERTVCDESAKIEACGDSYSLASVSSNEEVSVPQNLACGYGDHEYTLVVQFGAGETDEYKGTLTVNQKGDLNPHKGNYLVAGLDPSDNALKHFYLTYSYPSDASLISGHANGAIYVTWVNQKFSIIPDAHETSEITEFDGSLVEGDLGSVVSDSSQYSSKIQTVLNEPFGEIGSLSYWNKFESETDTLSPVHLREDYDPQGELIRGGEPVHYGEDGQKFGGGSELWFICREGAKMSDGFGGETQQVVKTADGQLYKCDTSGNEWATTTECIDGLDNDGDGNIDYDGDNNHQSDPDCGGSIGGQESPYDCTNPVIAKDSNGKKTAFYGDGSQYSPSGGDYESCSYGEKQVNQDLDVSQNPIEFECDGGTASGYSGPTSIRADSFCTNSDTTAQNPMPAVQYFISKQYMPLGASEWVTSEGFKSTGFQTLHQAEGDYSGSGGEHDPDTWSNKDMQDIYGYEDGDQEFYEEAWVPANAGSSNDNVSSEGELGKKTAFTGGYFGKCEDDKFWVYSAGEWRCDIGPSETPTVEINSYYLEDIGGNLAGFQINGSEMEKWGFSYPGAPPEGNEQGVSPVEIRAECWLGAETERPDDSSKVTRLSAQVQEGDNGEPKDTYIVGEIPERPEHSNKGEYTCVFGFRQQVDTSQTGFSDLSAGTVLFSDGVEVASGSGEVGFITEGTNSLGNIRVSESRFRPDSDMQEWLEGREASTVDTGELWPNFPESQFARENRHPWQAVLNQQQ